MNAPASVFSRAAPVCAAAIRSPDVAPASTASAPTVGAHVRARRLNPAKLRLSKWTAVSPSRREKHWLVVAVHAPLAPAIRPEFVDLEAVHSRRVVTLPWRELTDPDRWLQGWK
ncbi:MAG: hypothetical protein RIS35_1330 [Pseudomonadota bacterium]|jgi:tryptophan-rich hypothetical protein